MAVANGFGKVVTSGSVFMYDTGDTYNSYIGEPTTNLYTTLGFGFYQQEGNHTAARTVGPAPNLNLPSNYDYTTITTTGNWQAEVNRIIIWTNSTLSSGTYNISFWARVTSTTTATMGCAFYGNGVNNTMSLTNQWQRFSIQSTTHPLYRATEFGSLSGAITFQIAGLQIESVSHATQYVNGVRSTTQGLLPIVGNSTITLSNMSYDSNAQMTFDGTDDNIDLNTNTLITGTNPFTIESVINLTSGVYGAILNNYGPGYGTGLWWSTAGLYIQGSVYYDNYSSVNQGWHHLVATRDASGNVKLYRDGVLSKTGTLTASVPANVNWRIGADVNGAGEALAGNIPIVKTYDRVLSADEVKQNYNKYKTRFNLP